ncbi:hypothetical protein JCGZ_24321 [Jatropha curcas]|uniref:Uncharacterized protein n=1 Tax=Jatropha curcas TaxID=180498 RepID=A0A067L286_JATCU|nr:hypothetical protein JCGZ_24321 [Jatropha curcas]
MMWQLSCNKLLDYLPSNPFVTDKFRDRVRPSLKSVPSCVSTCVDWGGLAIKESSTLVALTPCKVCMQAGYCAVGHNWSRAGPLP